MSIDPTDLAHFNAGIKRARIDYANRPTSFAGTDTCSQCVWPVIKRNCAHCRAIIRNRQNRARRSAA